MGKSIKDIIYNTDLEECDSEWGTNPALHIVGIEHKICMMHFVYYWYGVRRYMKSFNTCKIIGRKYNNCINFYRTDIIYKLRNTASKNLMMSRFR